MPLLASVDVIIAARRHLASIAEIRSVLGSFGPNTPESVWLFSDTLNEVGEGSGVSAAVLSLAGGWSAPNTHNTAKFPRLQLEIYSDATRDNFGNIIQEDAKNKALACWAVFDKYLHRTDAFAEHWGAFGSDPGMRVWGSQLLAHPDVEKLSDWQGGRVLTAYYGLSVG